MRLRRPPFIVPCLPLLALWACGPAPSKPQLVAELPPATTQSVRHNLANGAVPSPEEVTTGTISKAPDACEEFRRRLPWDWFQERLEVPENPGQPDGRKIHVFYYGKINAGTVPTVFFNGGP